MDDKLKERKIFRDSMLEAADLLEKHSEKYCGHRNQQDIKRMGRGNAFAWVQEIFAKKTGNLPVLFGKNAVVDYSQFNADMEEFNQGKQFRSCGGKRYPLWTRDAKAAADGLRKYAKKHFKDVDQAEQVAKIAQDKQALKLTQEKKNPFLPKDGKKDNFPVKL